MEFQDVVRKRKMVRSFEDRPIPRDLVDRILANAQRAPSAGFSQGWALLALEAPSRPRATRARLAAGARG
jgi:nitroreductase